MQEMQKQLQQQAEMIKNLTETLAAQQAQPTVEETTPPPAVATMATATGHTPVIMPPKDPADTKEDIVEQPEKKRKIEEVAQKTEQVTAKPEEAERLKTEQEKTAQDDQAARKKAEQEEAAQKKAEQEEAGRLKKEQEEAAQKKAEQEEAERLKKEQEEAAQKKAEQEEAERLKKEQEKQKKDLGAQIEAKTPEEIAENTKEAAQAPQAPPPKIQLKLPPPAPKPTLTAATASPNLPPKAAKSGDLSSYLKSPSTPVSKPKPTAPKNPSAKPPRPELLKKNHGLATHVTFTSDLYSDIGIGLENDVFFFRLYTVTKASKISHWDVGVRGYWWAK